MSGWACVLRTDGGPVARTDIEPMLPQLRARAPDGEAHAALPPSAPSCALAMTILDTHDRTPQARGPVRVGPLTAVGQVRIDAREDVARALGIGFADRLRMTDLELFVRAFLHFGDGVLARVGGEYSGAIFDERTREVALFRDGFGVRQCFVARVGPWLVASNTLGAVRLHAAVSDALDDDAILDFLLFDWIMDKEKTAFRDIARLHPGHVLRVDGARVRNSKSWVLELPPVDRRSSMEELGRRFRAALDAAVSERLGARTSIFLSGGIDSTSIAVSAASLSPDRSTLHAVTMVSSRGDDEEGLLAADTARVLGLSHVTVPGDRLASTAVLATTPLHSPEPTHDPYAWDEYRLYPEARAHAPIVLDGEGGDEIWRAHTVRQLIGRVPAPTLTFDVVRALARGLRPDFGTGLIRRLRGVAGWVSPEAPTWLAPAFSARAAERWEIVWRARDLTAADGERGLARVALQIPMWAAATLAREPEVTGSPLDVRFPLLDRRVVDAALQAPSFPGASAKRAARAVLRDHVSPSLLDRPKTGVTDTLSHRLRPHEAWRAVSCAPSIGYYVDVKRFVEELATVASPPWARLRPLILARWLLGGAQRGR